MQMTIRKSFPVITATSIVLFLIGVSFANIGSHTASVAQAASGDASTLGGVASVNGAPISQDEFENALAYQLDMAAIQGVAITDDLLPELKYEVLENLINQELLYQESQKSGVRIGEEEVSAAFEERKQKASFETDAEFEAALKMSNKTITSYRDEIRQGLAIDQFIKTKFTDTMTVSEADAKSYYDENPAYFQQAEQVRASHILIRFAQDGDTDYKAAARKKIEAVMKRLDAGEAFATVAMETSDDTNSGANGGDLGYISRGQTPQSFQEALFALKTDDISDIVETEAGYHIIKLTDRQPARTVTFDEAKDTIVSSLTTSAVNSRVSSYLKELKINATVTTYPLD